MNAKEYDDELKRIIDKIKNDENVKSLINNLSQYKPRRLGLDYIESLQRMKEPEKYNSILECVANKYLTDYVYDYVEEVLALSHDAYEYRKSTYNARRCEFTSRAFYNDMSIFNGRNQEGEELYKTLFALNDFLGVQIMQKVEQEKYPYFDWIDSMVNMGEINRFIMEEKYVILISSEMDCKLNRYLSRILSKYGKTVYLINEPKWIDDSYDISKSIEQSIEGIIKQESIYEITPIGFRDINGDLVLNTDYIVEYLRQNCCENYLNIIASGYQIDDLLNSGLLKKNMQRITARKKNILENNLAFAIVGDYLNYISKLYGEEVEKLIKRPATCKFSIVIPVRKCSYTLKSTLRTLLNQEYDRNYEILISDNSAQGSCEIYNLCMEINDEKIVYLKTPRDLSLPKSFEFAYLHAKGEYIIGLGADDGLLPWALKILEKVTNAYPEEMLILWERGFYAWPGFNGGQQNQLVIPREYSINNYEVIYKDCKDLLASVLFDPSTMYSLPLLYINSCYKREYLFRLLEKTGRLWDGPCQDIYMGVVNVAINPHILTIKFPLAIAGMSNNSVGANSLKSQKTNRESAEHIKEVKKEGNMGGYCRTIYEELIPLTGTDTWSFYTSFLRCVSIGVLPIEYLEKLVDWKKWYINLASELDIQDVAFDRKIHEMQYCASLFGEEFLEWFNKGIYEYKMRPVLINSDIDKGKLERSYVVGKDENGKITLDASEYGVTNIEDAVSLFVNIIRNSNIPACISE